MVSIAKETSSSNEQSGPSPVHRLLQAARLGQVAEVSSLLLGAHPPVTVSAPLTQSGRTLLHIAAHHGHLDVVLVAVTQIEGVDVNITNKTGHTPLHEASAQGQTHMSLLLLSLHGNVSQSDKDGVTCLMLASHSGHLDTAKVLIAAGADVTCANNQGWTALHYAALKGHVALVRLLLHQGADIEAVTTAGKWAGQIAEEEGQEACFEELRRARGEATMATDSQVVAMEGQLLLLRERESRLTESYEALLAARRPSTQDEGMEELVRSLQAQLSEREHELVLLNGSKKKTALPSVDSTKTSSAPSSPRPPRKFDMKECCTADPGHSSRLVPRAPVVSQPQLLSSKSDEDLPAEADLFGGRSITELVEMSMQNPNCMSAIRKEIKADKLTPRIQRKFIRKTPQKSLSPLANEDISRQGVSPLATESIICTAQHTSPNSGIVSITTDD